MGFVCRGAAVAALIALGGCSQSPAAPAAKLFTLFDVQALYAGGAPGEQAIADDDGLPGGIRLDLILKDDGSSALDWRSAWANNDRVAFLTTEVWTNYPEVWMQPVYVPVTSASPGGPIQRVGRPIFTVGAASAFYSPFLQVVYVEVPADTAPDLLTSARQILDGGYPLRPGEGRTMPLVPDDVALPLVANQSTGVSPPSTGYLGGASVSFLDFGSSSFTWDPSTNVVQEAPIYVLTFIGADGSVLASPSIPTILGPGPAGSGLALPDGAQRNYAYYRVHTVVVPSTARVFVEPSSQLDTDLYDAGLQPFTGFAPGASAAQITTFSGRVALNPGDPAQGVSGCFDNPMLLAHVAGDPTTCTWLGSEAALQANLDLSTEETTDITVAWEVTDLLKTNTDGSVMVVPGRRRSLCEEVRGLHRRRRSVLRCTRLRATRDRRAGGAGARTRVRADQRQRRLHAGRRRGRGTVAILHQRVHRRRVRQGAGERDQLRAQRPKRSGGLRRRHLRSGGELAR